MKRTPEPEKTARALPKFADEDAERAFWAGKDVSDYFDWSSSRRGGLPKLKPSTTTISLRLPIEMLDELRMLANVTYPIGRC